MTQYLHSKWKEHAHKTPNTTAIDCEGEKWSYSHLLEKVYEVKNSLPTLISPNKNRLVAIYGEKTLETVAAILGTLEAGFGYVGITPWADSKLLERNLAVSNLEVMITTKLSDNQKTQLSGMSLQPRYLLDLCGQLEQEKYEKTIFLENNSNSDIRPNIIEKDPAYVLFTSGSTGQSKGVSISHKAAMTAIDMYLADVPINCEDVIGSQVDICFDLSVFDIFATLSSGATLNLIPSLAFSGKLFDHLSKEGRVDSMFTIPSIIEHELKNSSVDNLPLNRLLFSGEPVSENLVRQLVKRFPSIELWNMYGATEFPYGLSKKIDPKKPKEANIFRLSENKRNSPVRIVDLENPLKDSKKGQLIVGGDVLFSKYLYPDGAPSTYSRIDGNHPTGDVASIKGDYLKLCGRVDRQVKVGGIRTNLDDIEQELEEDPNILEAAAVVTQSGERLALNIVTRDGSQTYEPDLPTICYVDFYHYNALPRTASGKKDRQSIIKKLGEQK